MIHGFYIYLNERYMFIYIIATIFTGVCKKKCIYIYKNICNHRAVSVPSALTQPMTTTPGMIIVGHYITAVSSGADNSHKTAIRENAIATLNHIFLPELYLATTWANGPVIAVLVKKIDDLQNQVSANIYYNQHNFILKYIN